MIISFDRKKVLQVLAIANGQDPVRFSRNPLDEHALRMGIRLVGSEGVYLVPDTPAAIADAGSRVHAYEANPSIMEEEAWRVTVERVFGTPEGGEELLTAEVVNQWMCRSLLSALRLDVKPLSIRLIYDYDVDFETGRLFLHDGLVERSEG